MALLFSATSDRVNHGSASILDDNIVWSQAFWLRWNSNAYNYMFLSNKEPNSSNRSRIQMGDALNGSMIVSLSGNGGLVNYNAASILPTQNKWYFFGVTVNGNGSATDRIRFYVGDLNTPVTQFTHGVGSDFAITAVNNAAANLWVGNDPLTQDQNWEGDIAFFGYWDDVRLTEAQFEQQRMQLWTPVDRNNCAIFSHYALLNSTTSHPDWSGNANHGTSTGATKSSHVPVRIFPVQWLYVAPATYEDSITLAYELQCAEPFGATEESIVGGLAKDLDLALAYDTQLESQVALSTDRDLQLASDTTPEATQSLEVQLSVLLDAEGVIDLALDLSSVLDITVQDTIITEEQTAISTISDLELSDQLAGANEIAPEEDKAVDLASSATAEASQALEIDHDITQTSQISIVHPINLERDEEIGISDTLEAETALELPFSASLEQVDQIEIGTNIQLSEENAVNLLDQIVVEEAISLSRSHDLSLADDISKEEYLSLEVDQAISLDTSATAESTLDLSLSQELAKADQLDAQNALDLVRDEEIALADQTQAGTTEESIDLSETQTTIISDLLTTEASVSLDSTKSVALLSGVVVEESITLGYDLQCAEPLAPTYIDPVTLEEVHAIGIEEEVVYGGTLALGKTLDVSLASDASVDSALLEERSEAVTTEGSLDIDETVSLERTESVALFTSFALYNQIALEETYSLDLLDQLDVLEEVTLDINLEGTFLHAIDVDVSITLAKPEAIALIDTVGEYDESITLSTDFASYVGGQVDFQSSVDFEQTLSLVLAPSASVENAVTLLTLEEIALLDELVSQTYEEAISLGINHAISSATQLDAQNSVALELTESVSYATTNITTGIIALSHTQTVAVAYDLVVYEDILLEQQKQLSSLDVITVESSVDLAYTQQYTADSQAVVPAILDIETLYNLPVVGSQVWAETLAILTNYGILYDDEWLHLGQLPRDIVRLEVSIATTLEREVNLNTSLQLEAGINTEINLDTNVPTEIDRTANVQTELAWTLEI